MQRTTWITFLLIFLMATHTANVCRADDPPVPTNAAATPGPVLQPDDTISVIIRKIRGAGHPENWGVLSYTGAAFLFKVALSLKKEAAAARKTLLAAHEGNVTRQRDRDTLLPQLNELDEQLENTIKRIPGLVDSLENEMRRVSIRNKVTGKIEHPYNSLDDVQDLLTFLDTEEFIQWAIRDKRAAQWEDRMKARIDALESATDDVRNYRNKIVELANPHIEKKFSHISRPSGVPERIQSAESASLRDLGKEAKNIIITCEASFKGVDDAVASGAHLTGRMGWIRFWINPKNNWKMVAAGGLGSGGLVMLGNHFNDKYNSDEKRKEQQKYHNASQHPYVQYMIDYVDKKGQDASKPFRELIQEVLFHFESDLASVVYHGANEEEKKATDLRAAVSKLLHDEDAVRIAFNKASAFSGIENGQFTLDSLLEMLKDSRTSEARRKGDATEFFKKFYDRFFNTLFADLVEMPSETIEFNLMKAIRRYTLKRLAGEKDIAPVAPTVPDQGTQPAAGGAANDPKPKVEDGSEIHKTTDTGHRPGHSRSSTRDIDPKGSVTALEVSLAVGTTTMPDPTPKSSRAQPR